MLAAGLVAVVVIVLGATLWSVASTIADGATVVRSYDGRCAQASNVVFPKGSCAPLLRAEDFTARRATLVLSVTRSHRARMISYTFENRTAKLRSFDWTAIELTTPTGTRTSCGGDVTTERYPAPPSTPKTPEYPCMVVAEPGRYTASYAGVEVAHVEIRSTGGGDRVRATS